MPISEDGQAGKGTRFTAMIDQGTEGQAPQWDFGSGTQLVPLADGRVTVTNEAGDLLGGIEAPWAVDAKGTRLPTRYEVSGSTLVQRIDTNQDTVYPVVADPTVVTFPNYLEVRLNKEESLTAVSGVAACTAVFSKSPHWAGKALTVGCGTITAISTTQLANGKCLTIHVAGVAPPLAAWWPTFPPC